ncbi:hypothetical protein ACLQ3F_12845 [Micromonospora sp. DT15]|uniref:hypothetical protein n=1 Tax=Micromonospora sp. DT15 TaxID=3393445 RepID=UPI003CEA8117
MEGDDSSGADIGAMIAEAGPNATILQARRDLNVTYVRARVPRVVVSSRDVNVAVHAFSPPQGYERAEHILWRGHGAGVVVLMGEPRTGRQTCALSVLCLGTAQPVHRLNVTWGEYDFRDLPREVNARYLLDITYAEELSDDFAANLRDYGRELEAVNAKLVVIASTAIWQQYADELADITASIGQPQVLEVLRVRLDYQARRTAMPGGELLDVQALAGIVEALKDSDAPPDYGVALAFDISAHSESQEELLRFAASWKRWNRYIVDHLAKDVPGSAGERILLIAAAILGGATVETLSEEAGALSEKLGIAVDPTRTLEGADIRQQLAKVGARRIGDRIYLSARGADHDEVIDYLWEQRPNIRKALFSWITDMSARKPTDSAESRRLIEVVHRLASRHRWVSAIDVLFNLLSGNRDQNRRAYAALAGLLEDPHVGQALQKRLYDWAGGSRNLVEVARLCGGKVGDNSFTVAVVRLRRVASRAQTAAVRLAVQDALRSHVERTKLTRVLSVVEQWPQHERTIALTGLLDPEWLYKAGHLNTRSGTQGELGLLDPLADAWLWLINDPAASEFNTQLIRGWGRLADLHPEARSLAVELLATVVGADQPNPPIATIFQQLSPDMSAAVIDCLKGKHGIESVESRTDMGADI